MTEPIQVNSYGQVTPQQQSLPAQRNSAAGTQNFSETLATAQGLKFSNHAQKRLENRNITLSDDGLTRLSNAIDKAEKKGGRESLVLMDELAFIVNVKERLIVTALETNKSGEGVFTQIDTVVLANNSEPVDNKQAENPGSGDRSST